MYLIDNRYDYIILYSSLLQDMFFGQSTVTSDSLQAPNPSALELDNIPIPDRLHTLEEYSNHHFNPLPKRTLSKTLNSIRKIRKDIPWAFTKVRKKPVEFYLIFWNIVMTFRKNC